jgi:hypothetical protein
VADMAPRSEGLRATIVPGGEPAVRRRSVSTREQREIFKLCWLAYCGSACRSFFWRVRVADGQPVFQREVQHERIHDPDG